MSYYRIAYTNVYRDALSRQGIFKYIDDFVLFDLEYVQECIECKNYLDVDIEDERILDRDMATDYIRKNKAKYQYIGYDTGNLSRIICVEVGDHHLKATAALYDHPEHGLIWLEMY